MVPRLTSTDCSPPARPKTILEPVRIIGPWTHGDQDQRKSGERDFGPTAPVDYDALILRWMDHYLRQSTTTSKRNHRFASLSWVRIPGGMKPLGHLCALSLARSICRLDGQTPGSAHCSKVRSCPTRLSSEFVSDPSHPVTDMYDGYGAHDYRALVGRKDVLTFDSAPYRKTQRSPARSR